MVLAVLARRGLVEAVYRLRVQANRLGYLVERMAERDAALFDRFVGLVEAGERAAASTVLGEVAELRRAMRGLLTARYVLEMLALRLDTLLHAGDGGRVGLAALAALLGELRHLLAGVGDPELSLELGELYDMLRALHGAGGEDVECGEARREAQRMVQRAAELAERWMREHLPQLPPAGW